MKYFRYGHVDKIKIKVGDSIKRGQLIAQNGTGNGQWYAHCHTDGLKYKPASWTEYCIGKSKEWVEDHYFDITEYAKVIMPSFHHYGLKWLEYWDYDSQSKKTAGAKKPCYHPGLDLNGPGSGNADLDDPIHSACDGIVEYVYNGTGSNAGWGKLIMIKEIIEEIKADPIVEPISEKVEEPKKEEVIPVQEEVSKEEKKEETIEKDEIIILNLRFILEKIIELINKLIKK